MSHIFIGDIGHEDEDHFLTIVDRLKELIKYKGYQVAPASLEGVLLCHEAIADACVVGFPDVEARELPLAYIVKKPGKETTEKDIVDYVAGMLSQLAVGRIKFMMILFALNSQPNFIIDDYH